MSALNRVFLVQYRIQFSISIEPLIQKCFQVGIHLNSTTMTCLGPNALAWSIGNFCRFCLFVQMTKEIKVIPAKSQDLIVHDCWVNNLTLDQAVFSPSMMPEVLGFLALYQLLWQSDLITATPFWQVLHHRLFHCVQNAVLISAEGKKGRLSSSQIWSSQNVTQRWGWDKSSGKKMIWNAIQINIKYQ